GAVFTVTTERQGKWHQLASILSPLAEAAANYPKLSAKTKAAPQGWVSINAKETQQVTIDQANSTTLRLRPKPSADNTQSPAKFVFKQGAQLVLGQEKSGNWRKISQIITPLPQATDDYPTLSEAEKAQPEGWVYFPELSVVPPPLAAPAQTESIVVLSQPHPINAGELLGHIGHFQQDGVVMAESGSPALKAPFEPLLHLECFTAEDLPAFIAQGQAAD